MIDSHRHGLVFAVASYVIWGLFPLYWKQLQHVSPVEILAHRVVWTLPFVGLVMLVSGRLPEVAAALRHRRQVAVLALSALCIATNWLIFIWAVTSNHILQASFGYYLTPLVSVFLGVVILRERPRPAQWCAIALAGAGVGSLMLSEAMIPYAGLGVAFTFGLYGILRKRIRVEAAAGLFVETAVLFPVAVAWVGWLMLSGRGAFTAVGLPTDGFLLGAGLITALPLLLYVAGARRLPLITVGLLFYINPTLQLLLGTLLYDEPLTQSLALAFGLIWCGLAVYVGESLWRWRADRRVRPALEAEETAVGPEPKV